MSKRQAAGVPEGSPFIEVDKVRLAVARSGRGIPVVCLHAIAHGGGDFEAFAARMGERFEVIRVDWPGQGRSGEDHSPLSPARYAQLLDGLLQALGVTQPIIVGCSIGGAAAIHYAAMRPVRGLVLCDPGGLAPASALTRKFCAAFVRFFSAGARGAGWFRAAYAAYYSLLVLPSPAANAQRRRIVTCGYEMAPKLAEAWRGFGEPEADIRELAWSLDCPVWFAWARDDRVIPLSFCRPAIAKMKRATVTVFAGGHAAFLEQPDGFAEGFLDFAEAIADGERRRIAAE